jgi:hypothetical protein
MTLLVRGRLYCSRHACSVQRWVHKRGLGSPRGYRKGWPSFGILPDTNQRAVMAPWYRRQQGEGALWRAIHKSLEGGQDKKAPARTARADDAQIAPAVRDTRVYAWGFPYRFSCDHLRGGSG